MNLTDPSVTNMLTSAVELRRNASKISILEDICTSSTRDALFPKNFRGSGNRKNLKATLVCKQTCPLESLPIQPPPYGDALSISQRSCYLYSHMFRPSQCYQTVRRCSASIACSVHMDNEPMSTTEWLSACKKCQKQQ